MSVKNVAGILLDANSIPIRNSIIRFLASSTISTLNTIYTDYPVDSNGSYSCNVKFGVYTIQLRRETEEQFRTVCANVLISDNVTQTLEQLIASQSQIVYPEADILTEMQEILAQAQAAVIAAEAAATGAQDAVIDVGSFDASLGIYPVPAKNTDNSNRSSMWKTTVSGVVSGVSYQVGDSLVYSEKLLGYHKIDNTDLVTSVGGFIGNVTLAQLELDQVDNTSDLGKPISTATQTALNQKASISHSHSNATTIDSGFMSNVDKAKLDNISPNANNYVHPSSGIPPGEYTKVIYNAQGHATSGSTPSTLAGLGITDAFTKSELSRALTTTRGLSASLTDFISVKDFGAIGDGTRHNVQEWIDQGKFDGLSAIQVVYPHVTELTDTIDWAATQAALSIIGGCVYQPKGVYLINKELDRSNNSTWVGDGVGHWRPGTVSDFYAYTLDHGTNFLMIGTGPKTRTQDFITDCRCMGHVIKNPSPEVTMMDHAEVSGYTIVNSGTVGVPPNPPRSKILQLKNRDTYVQLASNLKQVKVGDVIKFRLTAASSLATVPVSIGVHAIGPGQNAHMWTTLGSISNTGGNWSTIEGTWTVTPGQCLVNHCLQVATSEDNAASHGWYVAECEMWINDASMVSDGEFTLTDFTNQDAIGITRATLKPFSAALFSNSRHGGVMSGMRFIPNFPDGEGLYGINGYKNITSLGLGNEWDVGLYNASTRSLQLDNVQFVGYWRTAALLTVPLDYGQQRTGLAEMCKYNDCIFQGIRGVSFRDGDLSPVLAVSSTSITTRWTRSHRYPTSGTLYVDSSVSWSYSSLSYDGNNQLLTFKGGTVPTSIVAGTSLIQQTASQGVANTTFNGCDITDLSHSSRICEYRPILGGMYKTPGSALELSGKNLRGVNFAFSSIYLRGPIVGHLGRVRNVMLLSNHYEPKSNYKGINTPSGMVGAVWIAGGQQGNSDNFGGFEEDDPDNFTGTRTLDIRFLGTSGSDSRIDRSPLIPSTSSLATRCKNWNLFNPTQFTDDTRDNASAPDRKYTMFGGGNFSWNTPGGATRFAIASDAITVSAPLLFGYSPYLGWDNDREFTFQTLDPTTKVPTIKAIIGTDFSLSWGGNIKPRTDGDLDLGNYSHKWSNIWVNHLHCSLFSSTNALTNPTIPGELTLSRTLYNSVRIKLLDDIGNIKYVNLPVSIDGSSTLAGFGITDGFSNSGGSVTGDILPSTTGTLNLGSSSKYWNNSWVRTLHCVLFSYANTATTPTVEGEMTISRDGYDKLVFKLLDNVGTVRYVNIPVTSNGSWDISTSGNADSSNKWSTSRTLGFIGDATANLVGVDGTSNIYATLTLSNSGITAGTYNNNGGYITPITYDAKGRATGAGTPIPVTISWANVTDKPVTVSGFGITDVVTKNGTRIIIPAGDGGSTGGVVKNSSDGTNQSSWLCTRYDVSSTFYGLGVTENIGPVYWNGTTQYDIYHKGNKPTAVDTGALPITGGTLTGTLNTHMLSQEVATDANIAGDTSGYSVKFLQGSALNKPTGTDHAVFTQSYSDILQTQMASDWRTNRWYIRTQENGTWKSWAEVYTTVNKPTAADVGALSTTGGTLSGSVVPNANSTYDLGSSTNSWEDIWTYNLHCKLLSYANTNTNPTIQGEMTISRNLYNSIRLKLFDDVGAIKYVNLPLSANGSTTLSGFGITDALPLAGGTLTGALGIGSASYIAASASLDLRGASGNTVRLRHGTATMALFSSTDIIVSPTVSVRPSSDGVVSLGDSSNKWSTVYANTGIINTSDERLKVFSDIDEAEKSAALAIKPLIRKFKFLDSIEEKGEEGARWHFGVGAQSVGRVIEEHGLDPNAYGFFCFDEWPERLEEVDEEGNVLVPYRAAGNRYSVRYDELAMFILSAM